MEVRIRRIYDDPEAEDGFRVLVDRLWPRGVTKEAAALDMWCKSAAPTPGLRTWFGHDPDRWDRFARRYRTELGENEEGIGELVDAARASGRETCTLLYGARDADHNHAIVLAEVLRERLSAA